jgi:hypothetical protein
MVCSSYGCASNINLLGFKSHTLPKYTVSCLRTHSPRPSIDSLDHHLSSGRKHISVVSWFSVAKRPLSRPVKLQSQPHINPWRAIRIARGRQRAARTTATVTSQCARRHLVAVSNNREFSALRRSPHSGCCTAGGGFDPRSGQRQSRVPLCVVLPGPCGQHRRKTTAGQSRPSQGPRPIFVYLQIFIIRVLRCPV